MTWKRTEFVVWVISGLAIVTTFALLIQGGHDRLSLFFAAVSIGVRMAFELVRRLAQRRFAGRAQ